MDVIMDIIIEWIEIPLILFELPVRQGAMCNKSQTLDSLPLLDYYYPTDAINSIELL